MRVGDTPATAFEAKHELSWSFEPIFKWLRLSGIGLYPSPAIQFFPRRFFFTLLQIALLCLLFVTFYLTETNGVKFDEPYIVTLVYSIRDYIYFVGYILMALAAFYASHFDWNSLWKLVEKLERTQDLSESLRMKLRKLSFTSIALIVLVKCLLKDAVHRFQCQCNCSQITTAYVAITLTSIFAVGRASPTQSEKPLYFGTLLLMFVGSCYVFTLGPLILFCIFCWLVSATLQETIDQVHMEPQIHHVLKWKKNYSLICDLVQELDHFFRFILIVFTWLCFVDVAAFMFCVATLFQFKAILISMGCNAAWQLILMSLIVFAASRVRHKVCIANHLLLILIIKNN